MFRDSPIVESHDLKNFLPSQDCTCFLAVDIKRSDRDAGSVGGRLRRKRPAKFESVMTHLEH
jgi:hypothetical protein